MKLRSRRGKDMSKKHLQQTDVAEVFRLLGITTVDRDLSYLQQLPTELNYSQRPSGVEYRTVLSNGTGGPSGSLYAELE
jgi:hypothetical protein